MKILCALWLGLIPLVALAQPAALERAPLHVGFTRSAFHNVNPADAQAAFLVFAQTVGRQRGYELDAAARLFDEAAALQAEIRTNGLHLVILDAWEGLDLDIETELEPAFAHENQGAVLREYLLFVRQGSGIQALADLRGQEIAVLNGTSNGVARAWLESLLLENGLGAADAFFRRVEAVAKPSAALLPVFFGNSPACIVDRLSYATMVEMNPQVERQLVPLAVSEPLLGSITYLTRRGYASERMRRDLVLALQELHLGPDGRQILTLFKVEKLLPFKEEYRDSLRRLRARLAASQPAAGGAEPAAGPARTAGAKP